MVLILAVVVGIWRVRKAKRLNEHSALTEVQEARQKMQP